MASTSRLNEGIQHQRAGRVAQAETIYRQILHEQPENADVLHVFGVLEGERGNTDRAIELIREAVKFNPNFATAWRNLGAYLSAKGGFRESAMAFQQLLHTYRSGWDVYEELGAKIASNEFLQQAVAAFREAIRIKPDFAEAYNDLGNVLAIQNQADDAIAAHSTAVKLAPGFAEAHYGLGNLLSRKGRTDEALAALRRAAALKPRFADAHLNVGNILRQLGRTDEAIKAYRRAIAVRPNFAVAYLNLGQTLSAAGRLEEALAYFAEAIKVKPNYVKAHLRMAVLLAKLNRFDMAKASQALAAELDPGSAEVFETLGQILVHEQHAADAEPHLRRAIEIDPKLQSAWNGLGHALQSLGRFDEASDAYRRALELSPSCAAGFGYRDLSYTGPVALDQDELDRLGALLNEANSPADSRIAAGFALGRVLDDAGQYDAAFAAFKKANDLCRKVRAAGGDVYDADFERHNTDRSIAMFDRSYFQSRRDWGERSELPVFIVGMPRSGTTLLHQIAARHPQVHGAGERVDIAQIARSLESLDDSQAIRSAAKRYLENVRATSSTASRIVDKMPANVKYLGLISLLFPHARVIFCRRDARDTCLSCYQQCFASGNMFSYDLAHCGIEYREVDRLMNHWLAVLPLKMLEVHYEKLVTDQKAQSRRLIEFLGLPWDPACLEFYRGEATVLTASVWQVRQPIYQSSIGRWRHYERHLGPLLEALGEKKAEEGI